MILENYYPIHINPHFEKEKHDQNHACWVENKYKIELYIIYNIKYFV